ARWMRWRGVVANLDSGHPIHVLLIAAGFFQVSDERHRLVGGARTVRRNDRVVARIPSLRRPAVSAPPAARAPRAATWPPRRRAWLRIFVVRCSLPCDPPVGGHSCYGGMIHRFHCGGL